MTLGLVWCGVSRVVEVVLRSLVKCCRGGGEGFDEVLLRIQQNEQRGRKTYLLLSCERGNNYR